MYGTTTAADAVPEVASKLATASAPGELDSLASTMSHAHEDGQPVSVPPGGPLRPTPLTCDMRRRSSKD
jgi:hypothetical protein